MNQKSSQLDLENQENIAQSKIVAKNGHVKGIFITGATRGIGLSLAQIYLKQNYLVGTCARQTSEEAFTEFSEEIQNYRKNHKFFIYQADVRDLSSLQLALEQFTKLAKLEILVANAGIAFQQKKAWPQFKISHEIIDVNIHGLLNTFEAGLDIFKQQNFGHLVAMSSLAGYLGLPGVSAYAASKAFIRYYCESLSLDLSQHNIFVTSICPGYVKTNLTKKNGHYMPFLVSADKAA